MAEVRVAAVVEATEAEGPGTRLALWVQGCSLRCPGCCNPHMFDPAGGRSVPVAEILERVARARPAIEGITLLGGEPFEQAAALAEVARGARALGLSVATFTGHALEELTAMPDPAVRDLLDATDLLVDGRYQRDRPERERRWAGSSNQRFHFLTGRYAPGTERPRPGEALRTVELRIAPEGTVFANGWPEL
jgi:anaerobic ribonucleoside-triphosphate reductase activating protein